MPTFEDAQDAATDEDLARVEARLGLPLPPLLRRVFQEFNGAHPTRPLFQSGDCKFEIQMTCRLAGVGSFPEKMHERLVVQERVLPRELFPFASDWGGNLLLADCSDHRCAVHVWWHDSYDPPSPTTPLGVGLDEFWQILLPGELG